MVSGAPAVCDDAGTTSPAAARMAAAALRMPRSSPFTASPSFFLRETLYQLVRLVARHPQSLGELARDGARPVAARQSLRRERARGRILRGFVLDPLRT